jgi:hypothetical protein
MALFDQKFESRNRFNDTGRIGNDHLTVFFFQGDVIVHPDKDAFSTDIQIPYRQLCHRDAISPINKGARA